jgi:hypothetical protein
MKARWTLSALGVLPLVLLAACVPPTNFDDFIGVNLIKDTGGDLSQWTADQSTTYMTLAPAGELFTDGSTAYRLEIRNLFKNGDFETFAVGPLPPNSGWSDVGSGNAFSVELNDNSNGATTIDGNSLFFSVNGGNRISYDLANGSADGMVPGKTYLIRFKFSITTTEFELSYNDNSSDLHPWNLSGINAPNITPFPPPGQDFSFITTAGISQCFSINPVAVTSTAHAGYIDDIRLAKIDAPCRISFQVPFSQAGRPNLIPGTYRFSFFVKADPSVTPATPNRFPANGVSFAVDGLTDGTLTYSVRPTAAHPTDSGADWSQWTELSEDFPEPSIPDTSAPDLKMLKLSLTPTDVNGGALSEDVGSVLIANPRLEFIPSP